MKRILVTGATGFIGGHVTWSLVQSGYDVVALVRPGKSLRWQHDSLQLRTGDVRDRDSLRHALADCDGVVHTAAEYALWSTNPSLLYAVNVQGTRNVLDVALAAGIERIVHTSTVGTTRFRSDRLADEGDLASPRSMAGHYKRSKFEAERIARRYASSGHPVIIVNPTAPVGAADAKPTPTGQVIVDFLNGRMPAYVDTGLNYVDVTDVADGHVLALEKGVPGQRYLLGSVEGNLTLAEMLATLSKITGIPAPRVRIPHLAARLLGRIDNLIEGLWLGREPRIPMEGVRMAHQKMWVDPSWTISELGIPQHPVTDAIESAARWYVANGYAPVPPLFKQQAEASARRRRSRRERVR